MTITFSEKERTEKILYIEEAETQGYEKMFHMPLPLMSDVQLRDEHGKAWEFFNTQTGKHDHACVNCFTDQGPCLGECAVTDENAATALSFEEAAKPLIKWMAENVHPHHTAVITSNSAELLETKMCSRTDEFLKD